VVSYWKLRVGVAHLHGLAQIEKVIEMTSANGLIDGHFFKRVFQTYTYCCNYRPTHLHPLDNL